MPVSFSFIIPAYNAEKTLAECINSILSRDQNDYEIIVINDGSRDETRNICERFSSTHPNIRAFHVPNAGAAAARNLGIDHANGEYILFCDSDDLYNTSVFSHTLDCLKPKLSADTLQCFDFRNLWPDHIEQQARYTAWTKTFHNHREIISFLSGNQSHKHIGYSVWTKIYSRKILLDNNIRFPERNQIGNKDDWSEDLAFNLQYYSCVREISVIDAPMYYLRKHGTPESQSEVTLLERIDHMSRLFQYVLSFYQRQDMHEFVQNFHKIFIWHMRRYFYLEVKSRSAEQLYNTLHHSPYCAFILNQIKPTLKQWHNCYPTLTSAERKDYQFLLKYLCSGNMFLYKLRSYCFWRILNRAQKLTP